MIDANGLYVQEDSDGGDCAHRTGLAAALHGLLGDETKALEANVAIVSQLEVSPGVYRRYPTGNVLNTNPRCFSRDQASRVILGYAVTGAKDPLRRWLKAMKSRKFFHQNDMDDDTGESKFPDIMGIGEWSNIIRGLDLWYLYPLLILLDINYITMVYLRKKWDGASLYVPDLKYALKKYPTPTAYLADAFNDRTPWLEEVLNNHDKKNNGCTELQELFRRLYEKRK
jgi:hypothetical protein